MTVELQSQKVRVRGTVQGVGFRPTVYRLAKACHLTGRVSNDTDGVLIRLSGHNDNIQTFLYRLESEAPPLAHIETIEVTLVDTGWKFDDFRIVESASTAGRTEVSADAATCTACLEEIFDPTERRYQYPFTNCTHCGPRLSIVQGIPYDRIYTTMSHFTLCDQCRIEYENPIDRRFHAQPIACAHCGPQLTLYHANTTSTAQPKDQPVLAVEKNASVLAQINESLLTGQIVAIKGLGGFHLCCDATNHAAVETLRHRKQRYAKPFALMSQYVEDIKHYCTVNPIEQEQLESPAAPIVLLHALPVTHTGVASLSAAIAPGSHLLGFMLPYTPLHHLICNPLDRPLVMTSGNMSGEPQIIDNQEAIEKLSGIADLIVLHNRDIANRIDDSVIRVVSGKARVMRRARGFAPRSIHLPDGFAKADSIMAYGAELKSTFCIVKEGAAILSQHQGDLENLETFDDFQHNASLYKRLFDVTPKDIAYDLHPEYLSSKAAKEDASHAQLKLIGVQHHHAHIASAMVENKIGLDASPVLGIALDGLGFGADGDLWGGEILWMDYTSCTRIARLNPVAMPGGAQAVKQPWRNTYAHICNSMSWDDFCAQFGDTSLAAFLSTMPINTLAPMLRKGINCPVASSAGRLFDAVAGALELSAECVQFEGQAAITLEMLVDTDAVLSDTISGAYEFTITHDPASLTPSQQSLVEINSAPIWPPLLNDIAAKVPKSLVATRFHMGLINALARVITHLSQDYPFSAVVLSGGCLQNAVLLQGLEKKIQAMGLDCLTHAEIPANDGGIALGQAAIAAAHLIKKSLNTSTT